MSLTVEELKRVYSDVYSVPLPKGGSFHNSSISIKYSQENLIQGKSQTFVKSFIQTSNGDYRTFGFPQKQENITAQAFNRDTGDLALIRSEGEGEDKKFYVEVWDENGMKLSIPTQGKHKHVYNDGWFGSFQWSPNGKLLAYIAERNPPKKAAYFEQDPALKEVTPGSKFKYKDSWGETYDGLSSPGIFIVNLETRTVFEPQGIPRKLTAGQVRWTPDNKGIVFVGWPTKPRRLGIVYCYHRPSALYYLEVDPSQEEKNAAEAKSAEGKPSDKKKDSVDKTERLTDDAPAKARSPRFSPSGKTLIYYSPLDSMTTHGGPARLCAMDWSTRKSSVVVDVVKCPKKGEFPGIFGDNLPDNCFLDEHSVVFNSNYYSETAILSANLTSGKVHVLKRAVALYDLSKDGHVLFVQGIANEFPTVSVAHTKISSDSTVTLEAVHPVDHSQSNLPIACQLASQVSVSICHVPIAGTPFEIEYILLLRKGEKEGDRSGVILLPHGGPHSVYDSNFVASRAFLALSGYHVVLANFRGSTGFGLDFVDSLVGKIGDVDIEDCKACLTHLIEHHPTKIDHDKIVYFGGSHAGFIGGHLIAREPRLKAAVLYNPVINLPSMISVTDIPDWCYVESGTTNLSEGLQKLYEVSPIFHLDKVNVPTLFLIGSKDLRVPPSQGISLYHSLKSRGIPTRALVYGENHRIEKTDHAADLWINVALWFQKHTAKKQM